MIIVENELSHLSAQVGVCEQCGEKMFGRRYTGGESLLGGASRGSFFICYDCIEPVIRWKKAESGIVYNTPARRTDYEKAIADLGGRPNTRLETDAADGAAQLR